MFGDKTHLRQIVMSCWTSKGFVLHLQYIADCLKLCVHLHIPLGFLQLRTIRHALFLKINFVNGTLRPFRKRSVLHMMHFHCFWLDLYSKDFRLLLLDNCGSTLLLSFSVWLISVISCVILICVFKKFSLKNVPLHDLWAQCSCSLVQSTKFKTLLYSCCF